MVGEGNNRRRFSPLIWVASAGAALALVLSVSGTMSAFSASIDNTLNSVGTGSIVMQEVGPNSGGTNVTCLSSSDATGNNAATCTTINNYGNAGVLDTTLAPGTSITTTVTISNTGTRSASALNVAFGACTQVVAASNPAPGSLCGELNVALYPAATRDRDADLQGNAERGRVQCTHHRPSRGVSRRRGSRAAVHVCDLVARGRWLDLSGDHGDAADHVDLQSVTPL
jgi:hypothetical protein